MREKFRLFFYRALITITMSLVMTATAAATDMLLIDDFNDGTQVSRIGTAWRMVSDRVMGGVSSGRMMLREVDGRRALCLQGQVSLENNGGFVQLTLDLSKVGFLDASGYTGVNLLVRGNGEAYGLHLKTADLDFPWQSYRSSFGTAGHWQEIAIPFDRFQPYRTDQLLDSSRLKRLGLVAIGRAFTADVCLARVALY